MVYMGLAGMRFDTDGVRFKPCMPAEITKLRLSRLKYRGAEIDIEISGSGTIIDRVLINGEEQKEAFLPANSKGIQKISIVMKNG
jgi:cellobiose phosphorylase